MKSIKSNWTEDIARCISMRGLNLKFASMQYGITHKSMLIFPYIGILALSQMPLPINLN